MNLDHARLALLIAPTTPVWTATVASYDPATYVLTYTGASGSLPADTANLALVREGLELVRVRSETGSTLTLAENPVTFGVGNAIALYNTRLPWPRYQRISGGVVFKDFDIAFPTPWQRQLPPTSVVLARVGTNDWQEAIYCQTGQTINLDASASFGNLDDALPLVHAWDAGTGGSITGTGATVTASYTTAGFRYLRHTVEDDHGSTNNRYIPVWVGDAHVVAGVTRCAGRWDARSGWTVDLEITEAATILQYSPAAVVDIETGEAIFFGFVVPNSRTETFERTTTALTLQSALAFSRYLHAYPFLVTEVAGATVPTEWAELYEPTLARALWFLLHWHSTLPEVVNVDLGNAPLRSIAGQEFTLGSVPQQMDAVLKSAFWQARGNRAGGLTVLPDPLYLNTGGWSAVTAIDLSDPANLREQLTVQFAEPAISQVRFGGVFQDAGGTFEPALVQAPAAPGPWGSPSEVNNLAPVDVIELLLWAGRHIAAENASDEHGAQPGLPVDPATYRVADLPDGVRIAVERASLTFDPESLRWRHDITGRTYGRVVSAVGLPIPPPIEFPPPELPPFEPPDWPPLPVDEAEWPTVVYVATVIGGVYKTESFTGRDSLTQPVWYPVNTGLPDDGGDYHVIRFWLDPFDPEEYQYCHIEGDGVNSLYRRDDSAGTWTEILSVANAIIYSDSASATGGTPVMRLGIDRGTDGRLFVAIRTGSFSVDPTINRRQRLLVSTNRGGTGTAGDWDRTGPDTFGSATGGSSYPFLVDGNVLVLRSGASTAASKIIKSVDGGDSWSDISPTDTGNILGDLADLSNVYIQETLSVSNRIHLATPDPLGNVRVEVLPNAVELAGHTENTGGFGGMWVSRTDPLFHWVLRRRNGTDAVQELWETTDAWATATKIADLAVIASGNNVYRRALGRVYDDPLIGFTILGFRTPTQPPDANQPHSVFALDLDYTPTPLGKAGPMPEAAPYTDSIPYTAGGAIDDGVQFVPPEGV
jgi:hypothetical protein